ncbi:unnamed protein product [Soboliphyme baturini]|uniref:Uncharacterized protein n=1 Tax=Soboliphyme baturini TaxID=241478 RepID=A0A183J2C2_9BILA|nr:unnamed protein product [Soboliphyme baturini]
MPSREDLKPAGFLQADPFSVDGFWSNTLKARCCIAGQCKEEEEKEIGVSVSFTSVVESGSVSALSEIMEERGNTYDIVSEDVVVGDHGFRDYGTAPKANPCTWPLTVLPAVSLPRLKMPEGFGRRATESNCVLRIVGRYSPKKSVNVAGVDLLVVVGVCAK